MTYSGKNGKGAVRLSVLSHAGKEAVVALLEAGHFFGEGCLAGQLHRMATATAMATVMGTPTATPSMAAAMAWAAARPASPRRAACLRAR